MNSLALPDLKSHFMNEFRVQIAPEALVEDVIVQEAYREENSIVIKWDSETTNILGRIHF